MTSRRKFILQCSTVAACAALPAGLKLASGGSLTEVHPDKLRYSTFQRLVGTRFGVRNGPTAATLELIKTTSRTVAGQSQGADNEPCEFSLIFRGTTPGSLPQDTHMFEHREMEEFAMFIVPVGRPGVAGETFYQAIFNHSPMYG